MISIIVFVAVLLSGSLIGGVKRRCRFEWGIPITCMALSGVLYICGMLRRLKWGVTLICVVAIVSYAYIFVLFVRKKKILRNLKDNFFTPSLLIFLALLIFLIIGDYGKLAESSDEFSHWMDSIKAMTYVDDFVTNPRAHSEFQSYPPAMALFQYFFQKITMAIGHTNRFNEWRMYLAYQVLALSVLFPFLDKLQYKKPLRILAQAVLLIFMPLLFFNQFYITIYIDPVIGIMGGAGLAMIFVHEDSNIFYYIYEVLLCFTLVLMKDVGLFFAIFISVAFAFDELYRKRKETTVWHSNKKVVFGIIGLSLSPLLATIAAKLSWYLKLITSKNIQIRARATTIDLIGYTKIFFFGNDESVNPAYFQEVVDNIKRSFFQQNVYIHGIGMSYAALVVIDMGALIILLLSYSKMKRQYLVPRSITAGITVFIQLFYAYSLGATYCSNFSSYEAPRLASYARYMNMPFLAVYIFIAFATLDVLCSSKKFEYIGELSVISAVLLITPLNTVGSFVRREAVAYAKDARHPAEYISNLILETCDGDDIIWFIEQEKTGYQWYVCRFNVRPNIVSGQWSIGEPFYEGDVWTYEIDADEWWNQLEERYDYVALYHINDYFVNEYGRLFADSVSIEDNALFKIDKEMRCLRKVGQ